MPACHAIHAPVAGCTTTAGAVNNQSAITTLRLATTIARMSPLRWDIQPWNAVPSPVPNNKVELRMWTQSSHSYNKDQSSIASSARVAASTVTFFSSDPNGSVQRAGSTNVAISV
jgi:hypothetical protein